MVMMNINGQYNMAVNKEPAERLLKELLKAICMIARDIGSVSGEDPGEILNEAVRSVIAENGNESDEDI